MESSLRWAAAALLTATLTGCKTCDLVEAELRYQSRRVRQLERCLCQKDAELETLKAQLLAQERPQPPAAPKDSPESVYRRTAMSRVSLGLGTGGRDQDRDGRIDAVQFNVVCHDYDGDAFKCPGTADLRLVALHESGVQEVVGEWTFEPDVLRHKWKSSLVGAGYQVVVPAPDVSDARKWKMSVRFTTLDGRTFEDERDVSMALGSAVQQSRFLQTAPGGCGPPCGGESRPLLPDARPADRQPALPPLPADFALPPGAASTRFDRALVPTIGLTEAPTVALPAESKSRARLRRPMELPDAAR